VGHAELACAGLGLEEGSREPEVNELEMLESLVVIESTYTNIVWLEIIVDIAY